MPSPFAKFLDFALAARFRKDSNGRTVFLPLVTKREAYFVDSTSDEQKLRALVRLYRGARAALNLMWSLLNFIAVLAPGSISSYYGGYVPLREKVKGRRLGGHAFPTVLGRCGMDRLEPLQTSHQNLHAVASPGRPRSHRSSDPRFKPPAARGAGSPRRRMHPRRNRRPRRRTAHASVNRGIGNPACALPFELVPLPGTPIS
jgi:hypothetical protein